LGQIIALLIAHEDGCEWHVGVHGGSLIFLCVFGSPELGRATMASLSALPGDIKISAIIGFILGVGHGGLFLTNLS